MTRTCLSELDVKVGDRLRLPNVPYYCDFWMVITAITDDKISLKKGSKVNVPDTDGEPLGV